MKAAYRIEIFNNHVGHWDIFSHNLRDESVCNAHIPMKSVRIPPRINNLFWIKQTIIFAKASDFNFVFIHTNLEEKHIHRHKHFLWIRDKSYFLNIKVYHRRAEWLWYHQIECYSAKMYIHIRIGSHLSILRPFFYWMEKGQNTYFLRR